MLEEKILNDYKEAMKNKDAVKSSVLSFLRSEMMNAAIDKRKKVLDDSEVVVVIKKQIKQHQDSIEQFEKGNRQDLVEKEKKELEVLKSYLPEQLSPEAVREMVKEVITSLGAQGMKDMGKVMKEATAKLGGKADGKMVSDIVRQELSAAK
ncbi:MAG: GatB/YqeY domain-containing protein [Candidatus Omnitrophica bacterium]|nr:GatB/YqeY domain-containing protein [Candidatus Omnitrophota bacterium]MDD5611207.1 GatB/YqeY domain-containing protein [Candidatus Omnitrophota bacterium]